MTFAILLNITIRKHGQQEFCTVTPEELKAECDNNHGCVPTLHKMTIQNRQTGEVVCGCWASWHGVNRKSGLEVTIQTSAGSPVHTFTTKRLESCAAMS